MNEKFSINKKKLFFKLSILLILLIPYVFFYKELYAIGGLPQKPIDFDVKSKIVPIWDGVPQYAIGIVNPPKARFVPGTIQEKWYSNNSTNLLFNQSYAGLTWYSPVPNPTNADKTKTVSYSQVYENATRTASLDAMAKTLLPNPNPSGGVNFKVYSVSTLNKPSYNNLTKGGYTYNTHEPYKGMYGEWRYMGYSRMGNVVANPYFPPDVFNVSNLATYRYEKEPWKNPLGSPDGVTRWDVEDDVLYIDKLDAIAKLLEQEPLMKNKGWSIGKWANHLSLRTDPLTEAGIFVASQGGYRFYRSIVLKAPESDTRNLRLLKFTITNPNGEVVGSVTRNPDDNNNNNFGSFIPAGVKLTAGSQYKVAVDIKNMSNFESVAQKSIVDVGYALGNKAYSNNPNYAVDNAENYQVIKPETYKPHETKTFEWIFTVPIDTNQKIRVSALINELSMLCQDNTNYNDDDASLIFDVESGHFSLYDTVLVDKNDVEQSQPTPGEEYKIRYYAKYVGPSILAFDGDGKATYPKFNIPVNSTVYRNIPPVYNYGDVIKEKIVKNDIIKSGAIYKFDTKYDVYEVPVIKASASVSKEMTDIGRKPGGYTTTGKTWRDYYNLSVSDVKVTPLTERPYEKGYQTFAVTYTIKNTAPSWLKMYDKDVNVSVALGNSTPKISKVHISKGENKNITEEIQVMVDPKQTPQATLKATVIVNYDKSVWEEDLISGMQ